MAEFQLDLKIDTKKLTRATKKISRTFSQPERLFKQIGKDEVKNAEDRIKRTKKDADDRFWQPWSYATLRERTRRGTQQGGLLFETGNLFKRMYYRISGKKLTVSNDADYAEYLQEGTRKMAARSFLGWSRDSEKQIEKTITKEIKRWWK